MSIGRELIEVPYRVTVGPGGNFSTIGAALEVLARTEPGYRAGGITAEVLLLSGFEMAEQVIVVQRDLSWIVIQSVDPVVPTHASAVSQDVRLLGSGVLFPLWAVFRGALPTLNALFDMQAVSTSEAVRGVMVRNSRATIMSGAGVINSPGRGLEVAVASNCQATESVWSGARTIGARVSNASIAHLEDSVFDNCVNAIAMGGASICVAQNSSAVNCSGDTFYTSGNSSIQLTNSDASGSGGFGYALHTGSGGIIRINAGATGTRSHRANVLTPDGIIFDSDDPSNGDPNIVPRFNQNSNYTLTLADIGRRLRQASGSSTVALPPTDDIPLHAWFEVSKINSGVLDLQIDGGDSGIRIFGGTDAGGNVSSIRLLDGGFVRIANFGVGFWDAFCNDRVVATP